MKETESTLRPIPDWGDEITLVPFSGVQMLDFGFDLESVPFRSRRFIERMTRRVRNGEHLRSHPSLRGRGAQRADSRSGAGR